MFFTVVTTHIHVMLASPLYIYSNLSGAVQSKPHQPNKAEVAQFYVSRARYSPVSGGGSGQGTSGHGLGFGSSAPRWPQQQSRGILTHTTHVTPPTVE